jgi:hypothetical protein
MSQAPTRQSQRIRCPNYRPRTTWRLPEIVSVTISHSFHFFRCESEFLLIIKAVAPTSFVRDHPHQEEGVAPFQETVASGAEVHDHGETRHRHDSLDDMSERFPVSFSLLIFNSGC